MNAVSMRTIETIATEINVIKEQTRSVVLTSSVEIGRRLVEAKKMVPHGEWGAWLETNVDYSQSTAQNLMALYKEYGENPQALGNLSYTKAVALLGIPAAEREQFVEDNNVEDLSARELQQVIKEKQKLEQELKEADQKREREEKKAKELEARNRALESEKQSTDEQVRQLQMAIEEARKNGDVKELHRLQQALDETKQQVTELRKQLDEKPVDAPAVIEKVPDDVQNELITLRKQLDLLRTNEAGRFQFCFEQVVHSFNDLLSALSKVKEVDEPAHDKFQDAVRTMLSKMGERLS